MISEVTGESKGYGLVKYISSEAAAQAKHLLTGKEVGSGAGVLYIPVLCGSASFSCRSGSGS
jgi:hypothetical protein